MNTRGCYEYTEHVLLKYAYSLKNKFNAFILKECVC